jgi:hypothetical protein
MIAQYGRELINKDLAKLNAIHTISSISHDNSSASFIFLRGIKGGTLLTNLKSI